jgi:hypothetical protein
MEYRHSTNDRLGEVHDYVHCSLVRNIDSVEPARCILTDLVDRIDKKVYLVDVKDADCECRCLALGDGPCIP